MHSSLTISKINIDESKMLEKFVLTNTRKFILSLIKKKSIIFTYIVSVLPLLWKLLSDKPEEENANCS